MPQTCQHDQPPWRKGGTAATMVAHLRKDMPGMLRQVMWHSFALPCLSVFRPFYCVENTVPESFTKGTHKYSADSGWWKAEKLERLCVMNYRKLAPIVQSVFSKTEKWELERAGQVDIQALKLIAAGNDDGAKKLIQQFCKENFERTEKEYAELEDTLTQTLSFVGADYLWMDYLKQTCEKAGLEMPFPATP
jgi:dipeptidase